MELLEDGQRYRSVSYEWKERFGGKVTKIMLISGCSCPNRDGRLGDTGCIFCSAGGSGEFAGDRKQAFHDFYSVTPKDIDRQIECQLSYREEAQKERVVAYFQAYTNTYGPVDYLEPLFMRALEHPSVCALSIATRPDCLSEEMTALLGRMSAVKPVMVELGLQTMHEATARWMHRGYSLDVFEDAVRRLRKCRIEVIVHTILGLKGESREQVLETMDYLNRQDIQGIKLQLLHVLQNTELGELYEAGEYTPLAREEYIALVAECLTRLRRDLVIHRLTGDGEGEALLAPLWSRQKKQVINDIRHYMKEHRMIQGMRVET